MVDWIVEAVQWLWSWVLGLLQAAGELAWSGFLPLIPGFDATELEGVIAYLVVANQWLPLDAALSSIIAYWSFVAAFVGFKFALKLIPGIG